MLHLNNSSTVLHDQDFVKTLFTIQGSIYIPIFCAGIVNNLLTILIISMNRDMRTATNCYLLNLAISDTLPLIVSLPFEISVRISCCNEFLPIDVPWGNLGCKLRALLAETSTNASILTISAFTIERYLTVCQPHRGSCLSTIRRAVKIQILIWFIAILSSTPYFFFTEKLGSDCALKQEFQKFYVICLHISATIFFVLPAFILCLLYALMAKRLYNIGLAHEIRWSKSERFNSSSLSSGLPNLGLVNHSSSRQYPNVRLSSSPILMFTHSTIFRHRHLPASHLSLNIQSMRKSAFKMLFAVVIAFIICYAPFHAQRLITSRLNGNDLTIAQHRAVAVCFFISGIFYYIGSTVNPIFYHLFSRKYRLACIRTMNRIFQCRRNRRQKQNFVTVEKHQLVRFYPNLNRAIPKTNETIYRSKNRIKVKNDFMNNKNYILRLSLPQYSP